MKHVMLYVLLMVCFGSALYYATRLYGQPAAEANCIVGFCPKELTASHSGETVVYGMRERFTLTLDERTDKPESVRCMPLGVIGVKTGATKFNPPMYTVLFEAMEPGSCLLQAEKFTARIIVRDPVD